MAFRGPRDVTAELELLARGKKTHLSARTIALCVLETVRGEKPARAHNDGVSFLDRLYKLPDTRTHRL